MRFGIIWLKLILLGSLGLFCLAGCDEAAKKSGPAMGKPGVSDEEIVIGSSLPLSGHASYLGRQTLIGAQTYLNYVNDLGGVHGRKIRLISEDDGYDPPRCVANTQKLIVEDNVFALFCYVGTPTTVKIIPLVQEAKVPLVGTFTGANALRDPFQRYIINIRSSYYQETRVAVKHLVEDLGLKRIAIFYQYDAYGFDGLKGTELALKDYNLAPVARGSYVRGTQDVEDGLSKIIDSKADAVVIIGTYAPCAKFISLSQKKGFDPVFYAVSFVGADEIARILGPEEHGMVIMSQVVPPAEGEGERSPLSGVAEYVWLLKRYYPLEQANTVGLEGFLNAKVLVEALQRCGRELDREKFIDAVESIENFDLGIESPISFSPSDHQGLEQVYFTRLINGRFHPLSDWRELRNELGR